MKKILITTVLCVLCCLLFFIRIFAPKPLSEIIPQDSSVISVLSWIPIWGADLEVENKEETILESDSRYSQILNILNEYRYRNCIETFSSPNSYELGHNTIYVWFWLEDEWYIVAIGDNGGIRLQETYYVLADKKQGGEIINRICTLVFGNEP